MASYRFCRSDDIPLLVEAYARCCPGASPFSVADYKRLAREIGLWASSAMLAFHGREAIAVMLAAKRETGTLVWRLAVHPDHRRRGHARHLLTSLSAKLAILGPPRITAELPEGATAARGLLEACGFRHECTLADFVLEPTADAQRPGPVPDLVVPVTVDDLAACGALDARPRPAWEQATATLLARRDRLHGLAVATDERILAWLVFEDGAQGDARRVVAFDCADPERRESWLGLLFGHCAAGASGGLSLFRVHPEELPLERLRQWGFRTAEATAAYAAQARPA